MNAKHLIRIVVACLAPGMAHATNTVGLIASDPKATSGYVLIAPSASTQTYLISKSGELVNRWTSHYFPGQAAYLLDNGHLFRTAMTGTAFNAGGKGGRVEEFDWDGNLLFGFNYTSATNRQHHDAIKLPNGNILMIAWEFRSFAEAVAAGRDPSKVDASGMWSEHLIEFQPTGTDTATMVWQWRVWDHLVQDFDSSKLNYGNVTNSPELIDLNFAASGGNQDWLHINGLDYHPALDQILISVRNFNEIWIIDHSTSLAEAASHTGGRYGRGGDLLYRWGNPRAYRRGTSADQKLYGQHNPQWVPTNLPGGGHITLFNNGSGRPGFYSTIEEIAPPIDASGSYTSVPGMAFGPTGTVWTYMASPSNSFYSSAISGCQRLVTSNTFICSGWNGTIFEVTPSSNEVWRFICPVGAGGPTNQGSPPPGDNLVFRAPHYDPDYPGLAGRRLVPYGTVELPEAGTNDVVLIAPDAADSTPSVRWLCEPDQIYTVLMSTQLAEHVWAPVATSRTFGTEHVFAPTNTHPTAAYTVRRE